MKLLLKLGLVLLIGFVLLGAAGYFVLPPAAKKAIESGTHSALGTQTDLESIKAGFGFGSTSMGIAGFTAAQPQGFEGPPFLEIGEVDVAVKTFSVLSDTVKVPNVTLDGLRLRLVQNGTESNFLQVYGHLQKLLAESGDTPQSEEESQGSGKGIDIGLVKVSGVAAEFDLTGIPGVAKSFDFELPPFEIDLSRKANEARLQNVEQATAALLSKVIEQSVGYAKAQVGPDFAHLIGGDVGALKARAEAELMALLEQGGGQFEAWKGQALEDLRVRVGEGARNALEGVIDTKSIQDALGEGAQDALDKVLENAGGKDGASTEDALKKSADEAVQKGKEELKKGIGGLLGDKKKDNPKR